MRTLPLAACLAATLAVPALAEEIKVTALLDGGIMATANSPDSGVNYGHLLTDKHDQLVLNQATLTAEMPIDPRSEHFNWGFKAQGLFGTDARYTHFLGLWDRNTESRYQWDVVEANLQGHIPVTETISTDVKVGLYATPMGTEVIPANGNYLYSHSYIFNFGLPYKHTGILTTTHATPEVDVYLGLDTGANTTFGDPGDNNGRVAGLAGFGLTLMGGDLTILGFGHWGPENPTRGPGGLAGANDHIRSFYDLAVTWKATKEFTSVTEFNFVRDDLVKAEGYGLAQYGIYALNDWLSLVGRAEVWLDRDHFFVAGFPGNRDFVNVQRGLSTDRTVLQPGERAFYGELTLGANIKPPHELPWVTGAMLRPEVRYDRSLGDARPFNDLRDRDQWSFGIDLVIPLAF